MSTIFIIDDSKPTVALLKNIRKRKLSRQSVLWSISCNRRNEKEIPDLIIMDIEMPKMNGLEALEIIKRLYPDMKIVVMTAYADMENTLFLEKGVIDFIAKPFHCMKLKTF